MSIKGLEEIRELYTKENGKYKELNKSTLMDYFMKSTIIQLKSMQKEIDDNWRTLEYYKDYIIQANKKIKKLEQKERYYPTEEEQKSIKVGLTD